ncbi:MAG: M15 family metallopeptidase [Chitinophagales bacterium]|nr:M15 family metallopeptidase [Chitinophagales bacterium]
MELIKIGATGKDVKAWQHFLIGQGFLFGKADGDFGEKTLAATIAFQQAHGLQPDGVVGNKSYGVAMQLGFNGTVNRDDTKAGPNWPPKPDFAPLTSNSQRQALFGKFSFKHAPLPDNYENIQVTDNWAKDNIILVKVPQLTTIKGSPNVYFHKKAAQQLINLWQAWENAGLLHLVLTYEGAYVPRFVRGSTTVLSNHAFGSAFDINYAWNKLGAVPALVGQKGSVRELVPIAHEHGFYWGGHFERLDGMHFEIAKIL